MNYYASRDENGPVMWIRGYALYTAHLIVLVFSCSMVLTALVKGMGGHSLLAWANFSTAGVWSGQVWRLFTYGLVNEPSLGFVVEMFMIAVFGRELERFFGRRSFLTLYACLYVLPPLLFTALAKWFEVNLAGASDAFALFIAFAVLYPNAVMLFNLLAKWVALVLFGIYTLIYVSQQNLVGLISLWATVGFAYAFVRYEQGRITLPRFKFSPSPSAKANHASPSSKPRSIGKLDPTEIDSLLDKIAKSGLHSLTQEERAKLEESSRAVIAKKAPPR